MGKSHTNKNIYRPCNKRPNATGITNKFITKFIKQSKHTIINGTTGLFWKNLDKHLYVHASKLPTKQIWQQKFVLTQKSLVLYQLRIFKYFYYKKVLQRNLVKWKQQAYTLEKVLLMTHLSISPILNSAVQMTWYRNSRWSRWLIC